MIEEKEGGKSFVKVFLYRLCQCTWGLPQTLLGLLVFLAHRKEKHYVCHGAVVTECERDLNISLGLFVFIRKSVDSGKKGGRQPDMLAHEYGHTIQSLLLGPLYLPVIGVPSWLWCNIPNLRKLRKKKKISYHSFYTEKWADYLGEKNCT